MVWYVCMHIYVCEGITRDEQTSCGSWGSFTHEIIKLPLHFSFYTLALKMGAHHTLYSLKHFLLFENNFKYLFLF